MNLSTELSSGTVSYKSEQAGERCTIPGFIDWVHRQNVEVTNAEWTKRRTTKRRMGQNAECQNVE